MGRWRELAWMELERKGEVGSWDLAKARGDSRSRGYRTCAATTLRKMWEAGEVGRKDRERGGLVYYLLGEERKPPEVPVESSSPPFPEASPEEIGRVLVGMVRGFEWNIGLEQDIRTLQERLAEANRRANGKRTRGIDLRALQSLVRGDEDGVH